MDEKKPEHGDYWVAERDGERLVVQMYRGWFDWYVTSCGWDGENPLSEYTLIRKIEL